MFNKFLKLLSGPALAHILTISLTPFFMTEYPPRLFGEYAFFVSLLGVFLAVSCFRFDSVILVCDEVEVKQVLNIGIISLTFFSFLIFFISIAFSYQYLYFLILSLISQGVLLLLTSYLLRNNNHGIASMFRFFSVIFIPIFQLLLIHYDSVNSLIIGHSLSSVVALSIMTSYLCKKKLITRKISIKSIVFTSKKYSNFLSLNTSSVFINSISSQFLPLSVKFLFGSDILGAISILQRLFITPLNFILRIIIQLYNKELSEKVRNGDYSDAFYLFRNTIFYCLSFCVGVILIVFVFFELFVTDISLYKTGEWSLIFELLPLFLVLLIVQSVAIPVSQSLTFLDEHSKQLEIEMIRLISFICLFVLFYLELTDDYLLYVLLYVSVQSLIYFHLVLTVGKKLIHFKRSKSFG